jgi:type IV fimbrial biogenesis protein FimT
MLTGRSTALGFTLIETMIAVAILSIMVVMAAPSLSAYGENSKVRGIAESFAASAQQARLEAIRTNQRVELLLTGTVPIADNAASATASSTAGNWMVRRMSDDPTPVYTFVEGKSIQEGSNRSGGTSSVTIAATSSGAPAASIIFSSAGTTSLGAPWWVNFGSSNAACAPSGSVRCLRVVVTVSGQVKACDPAATATNDTRGC